MRLILTLIISSMLSFAGGLNAQYADSLRSLGSSYFARAEYETAGNYFQQASELYKQENDTSKWVTATLSYGVALVSKGKVKEGLNIFLELHNTEFEQLPVKLQIRILNNVGWAYGKNKQSLKARDYYLQGIPLAEKARDTLQLGRLNNNISYTYQATGDYDLALSHQQKALNLYLTLDSEKQLALIYSSIFLSMMDLGLYNQAEPYIRKSLKFRENINNSSLLDVGYHNMAWYFEESGVRDSAIIYYQKSLELSRKLKNPYEITQTLINIGYLYYKAENHNSALSYFNEALEINREIDRPVSIARILLYIANVAIQQNDLSNTESHYKEALNILKNTESPHHLGNTYIKLAELEILKENPEGAQLYLADLEEVARENKFNYHTLKTQYLQGKIAFLKGQLYESLNFYKEAFRLSKPQNITDQITATSNLAKAYHHVGSDSAFTYAEKAFTLIDSLRTKVAGLTFRSGFFREHARFYNEVGSWYITQKNDAVKAFELIEAAKARVLMDDLAQKQERSYEKRDEATFIKKQQKAKQIDRLYNELGQAETPEEKDSVRHLLKDLEFEYQTIINKLHSSSPALKEFTFPSPTTGRQAQSLLDSETAILEYAFTDHKLVRIIVTENNIRGSVLDSVQTETARDFFTEHIKLFREHITSGSSVTQIEEAGKVLYQTLLPELSKERFSNLLIIGDDAISFLPFEALSEEGRYLIEDYNMKYLPSTSIFKYISEPHRVTKRELLALAGSGFQAGDELIRLSSSRSALASLPSALLEVDSIAVNFTSATILKNEDVTEAAFKSHDLSDFRFIHFATHAIADEEIPSQSGIILSQKAELESLYGEDGYLNSREISDLSLNADLVTLSACNTGMGKIVTGEGLLGLQRSFLAAGASSVVVSLWSIFDRSTSEFMSSFYQNMLKFQEDHYGYWEKTLNWFNMYRHPVFDYKTEALREAKLAMIHHPYYDHPVHWAPFILIGK